MKSNIAYEGPEYIIEWHCDENQKSQPLEYFEKLDNNSKRKVLNLFRLMGEMGQVHNIEKFRNEGDGIYAFKIHPSRFLCFFYTGKRIIITNAFTKKTQKMPKKEKDKALKTKELYK